VRFNLRRVNVLSEEKKQQVIALGRMGWSLRRIQRATHIRRETAATYLKAAGIAVRPPGGWGRRPPAKPANEVTTDFGAGSAAEKVVPPEPRPGRSPSASASESYRELIEIGLARGRNAMAIWQDLVDGHGFTAGYQSVKRFIQKLRGAAAPEARVVIETAPGEESQVDYGSGPMVRDPQTGKYRRTRLFVLTLGYSRKCVRLLVFRSSARVWAELHEKAFRRLGGTTRVLVLDNLREGVLTPDIYDPTLNPLYRDVLQHYGVTPLPCRVGDPDRKGKVESGVGHAQRTPLKGLRFESLEEAQTYLDRWEERWADTRIRYYQYGECSVHLDGCVEVEAAYYGAPPGWIGRRVQVQWNATQVRLIDPLTGQLLREHLRQERGRHRIKDEDRPSRTPLSTQQLLHRAERAGPHIGVLCQTMYRNHGQVAVRRILGVLALAKKYGIASTDDACAIALETGACEYRFVRRYLERHPQMPLSLRQVDPLIRQLTLYRDLIENRTRQEDQP